MKQLFSPLKARCEQTRINADDRPRTTDRPWSVVRGRLSNFFSWSHRTQQTSSPSPKPLAGERGQSIVLIALAMVGLIAVAGLAIDVGFVFVRGAQLQAAVDAAALAGVTELKSTLSPTDAKAAADNRAKQYMQTNEMPDAVVASLQSQVPPVTPLGQALYFVKADWEIELFFLRVVNFDKITITRSAEAAYFPLADIYASRYIEDGRVSSSNQSVFGKNACTSLGDPFSPADATDTKKLPKERNPDGTFSYTYRILVPKSYWEKHNEIEIELFDPETFNLDGGATPISITHSNLAQQLGLAATEDKACPSLPDDRMQKRHNTCIIATKELELTVPPTQTVKVEQINPYWFVRIDEFRKRSGGSCSIDEGTLPQNATETRFELYYYSEANDGTVQRNHLSSYVGKNDNRENTDLNWVTPGVTPGIGLESAGDKPFRLNISPINERPAGDVPGILVDSATEDIYIYLDVTSISGSSENGYELWAGPPVDHAVVPSNVNERNLYILNNPGSHQSDGAIVFAVGNLPMNSNFGKTQQDILDGTVSPDNNATPNVDIPLVYLDAKQAGAKAFIRLYDTDSGATPPITFYIDTIAEEDWSYTFGAPGTADPDNPRCFEWEKVTNDPFVCGSQWADYEIDLPGAQEGCDWSNPAALPQQCTPFYGGRLVVRYRGGFTDSFGWWISVEGLPYLTK